MLKKSLFILSLILPLCLSAQLGVGSWQVFPTFQAIDKLVETPSKIYSLSAGSLMSYDMDTQESMNYGINNALTETNIKNVYYNPYGKYLAVVYPTGNIDIIYDNGKSITLPDIKDAVMTSVPSINDVAFAPGYMAVATSFGVVVYNDRKMEVSHSGIYDKNFDAVGITDKYIVLFSHAETKFYFTRLDAHINTLAKFNVLSSSSVSSVCNKIHGFSDGKFLIDAGIGGSHGFRFIDYDGQSYKVTSSGDNGFTDGGIAKDGYYIYSSSRICLCDENGKIQYFNIPSQLAGQKLALWDDPQRVWVGNADGVAQYDFSDGLTELNGRIKGEALSCTSVGKLTAAADGSIYVSHRGYSQCHVGDWPLKRIKSYINKISPTGIADITPRKDDGTPAMETTYDIVIDPDDPDTYYTTSFYDGIYKVRNNEIVAKYNKENSTLIPLSGSYYGMGNVDFDGRGNLYAGIWTNKAASGIIHMLPAAARSKDVTTESDWVRLHVNASRAGGSDFLIRACKKSNVVAFTWRWVMELFLIDTKGTDDPSDDVFMEFESFIDQDGKEVQLYACEEVGALFEDSKGRLWVGYNHGVFIIPNPADFAKSDFRVQRIKVPRNDGTNFADYLLDGENVLCITEDGMGRKWIGTQNAGAYLVSENGTEIIEHFTPENSYLSTNSVYAIACDPLSNAVYFGTTAGLVKYNSDAAPGAENYNDVYAFPNPVRPDYHGWITVKGLMDNSLVKIADASGHVFYEGKSNGGMITWDGCDSTGRRVKTGVYYVFASQTDGSSSSGAVTKILVVK